jgi:hypothetical protein
MSCDAALELKGRRSTGVALHITVLSAPDILAVAMYRLQIGFALKAAAERKWFDQWKSARPTWRGPELARSETLRFAAARENRIEAG